MTNINLDACTEEKKIEHICKEEEKRERESARVDDEMSKKKEHLIDVKENNLRSKESLLRDDRRGEERGRRRRERDKVASHSLFSPFLPLLTNRQRARRKKEKRERERERDTHAEESMNIVYILIFPITFHVTADYRESNGFHEQSLLLTATDDSTVDSVNGIESETALYVVVLHHRYTWQSKSVATAAVDLGISSSQEPSSRIDYPQRW